MSDERREVAGRPGEIFPGRASLGSPGRATSWNGTARRLGSQSISNRPLLNPSPYRRGLFSFRSTIVQFYRSKFPTLDDRSTAIVTVIVGVILGALVTISSVGAGAIGVCALVILYPQLPMGRIVGSDIAHAVPLTLIAGAGHWVIGTVDPHIIVALLAGSLPGIILGSYFAVRVAEPALRLLLAATLIVVAGKLLFDHFENTLSLLTAFARHAPH